MCVNFFMWYEKLKTSCLVVFREEETFETAAAMFSREGKSRTNCLTWEVMRNYPLDIFFNNITEHINSTIWHFPLGKTPKLNLYLDLVSCDMKWDI